MRSGDFPVPLPQTSLPFMKHGDLADARDQNCADAGRVVIALVVLALLAWFNDGTDTQRAGAATVSVATR